MSLFSTIKGWMGVEQKSSLAALSAAFARGDDMGDGDRATLSNPYEKSVWVRGCIDLIAGQIASVPLNFSTDQRGGRELLADPVLADFWANPARGATDVEPTFSIFGPRANMLSMAETIEATVGWLKLTGNAFWVVGDDWLATRRAKQKTPFLIARPDRMEAVMQGTMLVLWRFTDAAGKRHELLPDQVMHIKCWSPMHALLGAAPYASVQIDAESDYFAAKFGRDLMRNNGERGPIVSPKSGSVSDEQAVQITAALRDQRRRARSGNPVPVFLTADVSVEDPKAQAYDAALIAQRVESRHAIAFGMGVPMSMLNVQASYSIGSASDYFRLIETGCMPVAVKLADAIEMISYALRGGKDCFAWFDWSKHSTMRQVASEKVKDLQALWGMGMPMEKAAAAVGIDLPEYEGNDKGYLPFSVQEVSAEVDMPESDMPPEATGTEPEAEDAVDKLLRMLNPDPAERLQRLLTDAAQPVQITTRGRNAKRVALWQRHMRSRASANKRALSKITKVLMGARRDTLAAISNSAKAAAADFVFDKQKFGAALATEMRKAAIETLKEAGTQLFAEVGKDDVFTMAPERALKFLQTRDNLIKDAADEIHARIMRTLQEGIDAGESTTKLAARVKAEFNAIDDGRAVTIAQTEVSAAYGEARQDAIDQAGVEWKEWLTSGLDNVRFAHLEAEGQRVRTNDPFRVGGEDLYYPGDSRGSPENVINCHCVAIAVADGGEENP